MKSFDSLSKTQTTETIVDNLIKDKGLYLLVADPKSGKSFLAMQLMHCLGYGLPFLNQNCKVTKSLYVSTELIEEELASRINSTGFDFNNNSFFYIKDKEHECDIKNDLLLQLVDFKANGGKLVIIDIFVGVNYLIGYDLNSYLDISNIFNIYRDLINKYGLTFLLIHHTNKNGRTLGSTALEGFVDGTFYLYKKENNKFLFKTYSRHFMDLELSLKRNEHLAMEVIDEDVDDLDPNLNIFLKYVVKVNHVTFIPHQMVATLNLNISPTKFGDLLNSNIDRLLKEVIKITKNRTAKAREYTADFIAPTEE